MTSVSIVNSKPRRKRKKKGYINKKKLETQNMNIPDKKVNIKKKKKVNIFFTDDYTEVINYHISTPF